MAWPASSARSKDWGTETLTDADLENEFDILHNYINDMMSSTSGHKHDGTTAEGPKILTANLDDSAGTAGDVYYSNGSAFTRLAIGTAGQALLVNSGATAPEWGSAGPSQAVQADIEAETNEDTYIPPDLLKHHPGIAKAWGIFADGGTPAYSASYNLDASITDHADGDYTVTITTDFSSGNYVVVGTAEDVTEGTGAYVALKQSGSQVAGSVRIVTGRSDSGAKDAPARCCVALFGDQ
jgi:hypothetical protein